MPGFFGWSGSYRQFPLCRAVGCSKLPGYRVTATVPLGKSGGWLAADPGTHTVYVTKRDNNVAVIQSR
ncbi:hypothetical protein C3469_22235 [Mycobacterium kansasii]|uniref:hypothetical protein n=1 Tax=Mycobacterium kansasii TaxID=1768 RepID=UPI000CDDD308|nr:hypothetical protein [Mycobacterium kansasii]POX86867.1 hypothetical protein C3B43_19010 [Mycobacterium kansasii]POX99247.1 hypothetical protein C3479_19725 [Mycobacterium kansasii]POY05589.1 hypothetical protein C3477_13205 [Mycobacterium kansasii]POY16922.1 hypothetical protein C3476_21860 [Mycobacterium kansasii]POY23355.1 hypothetical protein C3469_22235 [Mycobacterium kansasii]